MQLVPRAFGPLMNKFGHHLFTLQMRMVSVNEEDGRGLIYFIDIYFINNIIVVEHIESFIVMKKSSDICFNLCL